MKLYHISTNLNHTGLFDPRVPEIRLDCEEGSIRRISFSTSVAGCFTAIPEGGSCLERTNMSRNGFYKLFVCDTETAGIPREAIIGSQALYEYGWVLDAEVSQEVWVTQPLQLDGHIIHVTSWEEASFDYIPYEVMHQLADYDEDVEEAYCALVGEDTIPCGTEILSVMYTSDRFEEGETLSNLCLHSDAMPDFNQENKNVQVAYDAANGYLSIVKGPIAMQAIWQLICDYEH